MSNVLAITSAQNCAERRAFATFEAFQSLLWSRMSSSLAGGSRCGHARARVNSNALVAGRPPPRVRDGRDVLRQQLSVLETVLLRETSSIGLRRIGVARTERPREILEVTTPFGKIAVKVARGPYGPPQLKPEFDACTAAATLHDVPVRTVIAAALAAATDLEPSMK